MSFAKKSFARKPKQKSVMGFLTLSVVFSLTAIAIAQTRGANCYLNSSSVTGVSCKTGPLSTRVDPTVGWTFIFGYTGGNYVNLVLTKASDASTVTISTTIQGWYDNNGNFLPSNSNWIIGVISGTVYRHFFQYTIPGDGTLYSAAKIVFTFVGGAQNDEGLTTAFYNVHIFQGSQTNIALTDGNGNGLLIFSQLSTGPIVSTNQINPSTGPSAPYTVGLSPQALSLINSLSGGSGGLVTFSGTYDVGVPIFVE